MKTSYRISIDRSLCVGYGGCLNEAPDVFELDGGLAYAPATTSDPRVLEAAELCPVGAIAITLLGEDALAA